MSGKGRRMGKPTVIVVANQKGGVAKTTTVSALHDGLEARCGLDVACIDLDTQGNLTSLYSAREAMADAYGLLHGAADRSGFYAASDMLARIASEIQANLAPNALADGIAACCEGRDAVLVDTPPAKDALNLLALMAADRVIVPTSADRFGIEGIAGELAFVREVFALRGIEADAGRVGVLVTNWRRSTKAHRSVADDIAAQLPGAGVHVFSTRIRQDTRIVGAQIERTPLFEVGMLRRGAVHDYGDLVDEVARWIG